MPSDAIVIDLAVPLCGRKARMSKCVTMIYVGLDGAKLSSDVAVGISLGGRSAI